MAILGVSCDYHDAAAALIVNGRIVAAAEEERFTRVKHDRSLPELAVRRCLATAGLGADEVDQVVFYEKPLMVAARYLAARQRIGLRGASEFAADMPTLIGRNLMVAYRLKRMLRQLGATTPAPVRFVEHHRSHAAAAFHPSPFDAAAIVTVDGIGEWATATIGRGAGHRVTLLEEQRYPNSLGLVYSFVTRWCGFTPNDDEYKLMGLAPYGRPRHLDALAELIAVHDDGSVVVDARRLQWFGGRALGSTDLHALLGGPPRRPGDPITEREADLAASVQQLTESALLAIARRAHELTGEGRLCLAGGVALNCVANGRILREGPFEQIWVQPAAGDSGSAIGAALSLWHDELGNARGPRSVDGMSGSQLGPEVDQEAAVAALDAAGIAHRRVTDLGELVELVSDRLASGQVVGWFRGRMEFGPRALGNRSILADPRDPTLRTRLNASVKGRESFRPFAPAVMAEHAADWFELDQPSPYMLIVAPVRSEHLLSTADEPDELHARAAVPRSTIPACTHVDGSARVQTVTEVSNPAFHALLDAFRRRTGCPMLVNTSFNLAGEPIVASVEDAVRTAGRGGMDLLVIGDLVVEGADLPTAEAAAAEAVA